MLISWLSSNAVEVDLRERKLITLAGILPDLDGVGVVIDPVAAALGHPTCYWDVWHHQLHNIGFCLLLTATALCLANVRRRMAAAAVFVVFHLHLFCDLIGSKGPDGYQWPIPYLLPFSNQWQLVWEGQWALNAWPNFAITVLFMGISLYMAWQRGYSFLEMFSRRADRALIRTLHNRFGQPA